MTSTPPDGAFAAAETFRVDDAKQASWRMLLGPVALFPIVLFLLLWFMVAAVLGMAGLTDVLRGVLSALLAALITVGIVALWLRQRSGHMVRIRLVVGPDGVRLVEGHITRSIAWQDMTAIGPVVPMRGVERTRGGGSSIAAGAAVGAGLNQLVQSMSATTGLLGRGSISSTSGDMITRNLLEVNQGVWGADEHGRPLIGINPDVVDREWYAGRIGDWVRRFRPDLVAAHEQRRGQTA